MEYCSDTGTATSWDLPPMLNAFALDSVQKKAVPRRWLFRRRARVVATELPTDASGADVSGALPGEVITPAVMENEKQRRTLIGIFGRFAAEGQISKANALTAELFVERLPRNVPLPVVTIDGDGGVMMAWDVPGQTRTLASLADGVLCVVARAGSPEAQYLPEMSFNGIVPEGLLQAITP